MIGDALHTQRELSIQIVNAGGEYIWFAKDNQPTLCQDIEHLFQAAVCGPGSSALPTDLVSAQQTDKGHGRLEVRHLTSSVLLKNYLDWPGVEQVFKLERQVIEMRTGQVTDEVAYGLSSLTRAEADPARLLELTRAYWRIENGLHYRRDVTLHEDATRMRHPRAAQVWASPRLLLSGATLNNLLVGLLSPLGFANLPHLRRCLAAQPARAVAVLTRRTL